jgi:hypothetical protein
LKLVPRTEPEGDRVAALLEAILAELVAIRDRLPPPDPRVGVFLGALRRAFGDNGFSAEDALAVAADAPLGELAQAVAPLLGDPTKGLRLVARRLAKIAGHHSGGLALMRSGGRGASIYRVIQITPLNGVGRPRDREAGV